MNRYPTLRIVRSALVSTGLLFLIAAPASPLLAQTSVTNQATVTAPATVIDPDLANNTDEITTPVVQQAPELSLVKSIVSGSPYSAVGGVIQYSFEVTNTGNVALPGPVVIDDGVTANESCPAVGSVGNNDGVFDPGEIIVCTASLLVGQADLDSGAIPNTATAIAGGVTSNPSSALATAIQSPGLALVKTGVLNDGGDGIADAGDTISYTFAVTNTGNVTITNITLTDPLVTVAGGPIPSLSPGATDSTTFSASYTLTQGDIDSGTFTNIATVDGFDPNGTPVSDSDTDTQPLTRLGSLSLLKTGVVDDGGDGVVDAGDTISYSFAVTNTGNVTLTNITLNDPLVAVSGGPIPSLAPGVTDSTTFTASYTLTQADIDNGSFTNTASANGFDPTGDPVGDTDDDVRTFGNSPTLSIDKTQAGGPSPVTAAGQTIDYTIVVANTGNVTQTGVSTTDVLPDGTNGTLSGPVESITTDGQLEVGETWTYTISYTVTQADIDAGVDLVNTATVTTTQVPGPTSDTATTPV
ncbi:DUF11 domain-containing protein, partial [Wenzhouxiangella sp. XN79A]|uniref:DUF7507 domain-containing protein n=1 Tax=Wenzhouxiangella sp. XN79A TaxID=2724193 RepID=UPI00144A5B5B